MSDSATSDPFARSFPLKPARAHEICGAGATMFASVVCGMHDGPVLWLTPSHQREHLNPAGLAQFAAPDRFIFASGKTHFDVLWMAEEALRSGAVPVVVTHITKPLDLTAGRRLQLAAEAGKSLGLFVIPEDMGSNAAESRWQCAPYFDAKTAGQDSTLHRWQLIKNKSGTLGSWIVRWDEEARRIIMVSKTPERAGSARPPR